MVRELSPLPHRGFRFGWFAVRTNHRVEEDEMTLLRAALEATLTDRPFVEDELLASLPPEARPPAGRLIALRLLELEDRDEVTAEVRTEENSTLLLHGFADESDAEHTF